MARAHGVMQLRRAAVLRPRETEGELPPARGAAFTPDGRATPRRTDTVRRLTPNRRRCPFPMGRNSRQPPQGPVVSGTFLLVAARAGGLEESQIGLESS